MKISDRWSIKGGRGDFVLTQYVPGTNPKNGEPTVSERHSYHPNLEQAARSMARQTTLEAIEKETIDKVIAHMDLIRQTYEEILEQLENSQSATGEESAS